MSKYIDYDLSLRNLRAWLITQSHLPRIETEVLLRFIFATDGELENTKKVIEIQYTMRKNHPNIFLERDPLCPSFTKMLDYADILRIPGQTSKGYKVTLLRLINYDPTKFNHNEATKFLFVFMDIIMSIPDPDGIPKGEIVIIDGQGVSLKHLARISFTTLRLSMRFLEEASSVKIKEIHCINSPPYLDKILAVFRPAMKAEIFKLIQFHQPDTETIFDWVPRELLPEDYGGYVNVTEIRNENYRNLTEKRNYLMDQNYWVIDETKRLTVCKATPLNKFIKWFKD